MLCCYSLCYTLPIHMACLHACKCCDVTSCCSLVHEQTLSELSSLSVFSICSSQTSSGQHSSASSMQRNSSASTLAQKTLNVNTAAMKRRSIVGTLPTVNPRTATAKPGKKTMDFLLSSSLNSLCGG